MLLAYFVTAIASAILTYLTAQYINKRKERVEVKHHERGVWKGTGKNTKDRARAVSLDINRMYADVISVSSDQNPSVLRAGIQRNDPNRDGRKEG